ALNLVGDCFEDVGLRALAASPRMARLRSLVVWGRRDARAGLRALLESPHLAGLSGLDIARAPLDPELAALLPRPEVLPGLTELAVASPEPAARAALERRFGDGLVVTDDEES